MRSSAIVRSVFLISLDGEDSEISDTQDLSITNYKIRVFVVPVICKLRVEYSIKPLLNLTKEKREEKCLNTEVVILEGSPPYLLDHRVHHSFP